MGSRFKRIVECGRLSLKGADCSICYMELVNEKFKPILTASAFLFIKLRPLN